jgi:tetratricopeptide (TPR) repeat protein
MLLLASFHGYAQSSSINNQQPLKQIQVAKSLHYAESIFNDSLEVALTIIENNLLIAIDKNYKAEEALAYRILGDFNSDLGNVNVAYSNYNKSIGIYKTLNQQLELFKIYHKYGQLAFNNSNFQLTDNLYKNALNISTDLKDKKKEAETRLKIGELYLKSGYVSQAIPQYNEALKLSNKLKNNNLIIESNIGLGQCEQYNKGFEDAKDYYTRAKTLAEQNNLDNLSNKAYNLLTDLYFEINNPEEGIEMQQQAFNYNLDRGNTNSVLVNSNNISQNFIEQGKTQEAFEFLNQSTEVLEQEQNTEAKRDFIKTLSDIYAEQGLTKESEEMFEKYNELLDSFKLDNDKQKSIQAKKTESLLNTENKMMLMEKDRQLNEKMIDLLKRETEINNETIKKQTTITYLLLGGLLIIGGLAIALYRNSRQKAKANNLLVLKSLRTQMNPHFIFNSLNSVNSFIAKKDERSANKYLAEFSKLMREVLECSQEDFIPLTKEIEILKRYVNLEHFRFNSHFDFTFNVDSSINSDEYQIPPMLLQPFIENAIWHGLRYKDVKGHLNINFTQKNNFVEIEVSDNGIGREKSIEHKTLNQKKMKSTGIKNVQNRLEIIKSVFKKDLEISINDLNSENKEGTIVKLKLF